MDPLKYGLIGANAKSVEEVVRRIRTEVTYKRTVTAFWLAATNEKK